MVFVLSLEQNKSTLGLRWLELVDIKGFYYYEVIAFSTKCNSNSLYVDLLSAMEWKRQALHSVPGDGSYATKSMICPSKFKTK